MALSVMNFPLSHIPIHGLISPTRHVRYVRVLCVLQGDSLRSPNQRFRLSELFTAEVSDCPEWLVPN